MYGKSIVSFFTLPKWKYSHFLAINLSKFCVLIHWALSSNLCSKFWGCTCQSVNGLLWRKKGDIISGLAGSFVLSKNLTLKYKASIIYLIVVLDKDLVVYLNVIVVLNKDLVRFNRSFGSVLIKCRALLQNHDFFHAWARWKYSHVFAVFSGSVA